jgi:hypothetical protein
MESQFLEESYWTKPRLEMRAWFQRHAPSLGELYEGALKMVIDGKLPGRTRFVAHAVREIRNRLPDVIAGTITGGRVQYPGRLDAMAEEWKKAGFSVDGSPPTIVTGQQDLPSADVPIPLRLFLNVASLIRDHTKAREKPLEAALRLFGAISPANQQLRDNLRPTIQQWLDVTEWFVKRVHDSGTQDGAIDGTRFQEHFELFEITLAALVRGFFKTVKDLDEILEDANS